MPNDENISISWLLKCSPHQWSLAIPVLSSVNHSFQRFPKFSNKHATRMKPALLQRVGILERIFRKQEYTFCTVNNHEGPGHVSNYEREPIHTIDQPVQLLDCEGSLPYPASCAKSALVAVYAKIGSDSHLREYIRRIFAQVVYSENQRESL